MASLTMKNKCPLCEQSAHVVAEQAPSYQAGLKFTIMECDSCRASYVLPLAVDERIYGIIYENIRYVPGYNRYYLYACEVLRRTDPLAYISSQEESYWAAIEYLRRKREKIGQFKILEVGCGLGYFTYAMAKGGFDVLGIDISSGAIEWATKHYGPYYAKWTLSDLKKEKSRYDVVIMNQLIEHLPDVHTFLADVLDLLSEEGELILTTPNKTAYPGAVWETELPPVHLWWFGEEAMQYLAARHKCTVSFIDFTPFTKTYFRLKEQTLELKDRRPVLDQRGMVVFKQELMPPGPMKQTLDRLGVLDILRATSGMLAIKERWRGRRGPIIAAVLRRKG